MGEVLVLPGNHDFYTGEEKVWKDFEKVIKEESIHNIIVLNKFVPSTYRVGEDMVVVYPAYCQKRESKENNLGWIKEAEINTEGVYNIGIAHGTIEGIAPDNEKKYFWMSKKELSDIPVDVWLIGHTHVPYPKDLKEDTDIKGDKIYNAGTHEQTDVGNKTDGYGFVITLEKSGSKTTVRAHKYRCGKVKYYEFDIKVKPDSEEALEQALEQAVAGIDTNSIIRTNISGTITQKEYESKAKIYQKILGRFLAYEQPNDSELSEEITIERIRSEFAETSFAAIFLEKFIDNPIELQMAYQLLQECKIN
jgi:DNA repair exonuclease SbcCD nuclease subunit